MDDKIIKRLKVFLDVSHMKITEISDRTKISTTNLYSRVKGHKPSSIDEHRKLEAFLNIMEPVYGIVNEPDVKYEEKGKVTYLQRIAFLNEKEPEPYFGEKPSNSVIDIRGMQAFVTYAPDSVTHGWAEGIINVKNNSLGSKYNHSKDGNWIGIRRIRNDEPILARSYYLLIDKDHNILIGRYHPSLEKVSITLWHIDDKRGYIIKKKEDILFQFKIEWIQDYFSSFENDSQLT